MVQQKIQLRKVRDFGENLNDTFQFIRQEFKPLLTCFLLISGIFILAAGIVNGFYQSHAFNFLDILKNNGGNEQKDFDQIFNSTYFLLIAAALLNLVAMRVTLACYLKLYEEKGESPTVQEVWNQFIKYCFRIFIYSLLIWLMILLGCLLCIAPGVYLAVVFAPFELVVIIEDESLGNAVSRCFTLIKNNFWISLAIYLVSYLIYSFSAGIIGAIVAASAGLASYFSTRDTNTTVGIVTGILNIFSYLFYIVFYISVAMHYFNLTERADGAGIMQRLQNLGSNNNEDTNIEEEY